MGIVWSVPMTHPFDVTPALTEARLQFIAATIVSVRSDALDIHQPEKGDDAWTFGCVAYRRTCHAFIAQEATGDHPWLTVKEEGLSFTMFIEAVPLKFYKGDPDKPGPRNLRKGLDAAIKQTSLKFLDDEGGDWF